MLADDGEKIFRVAVIHHGAFLRMNSCSEKTVSG